MGRLVCPTCQCTEIDTHEASGEAVCVSCGTVVEANSIVSSVEFSESGGGHSVIGQFVSGNASKSSTNVGIGGKHYDSESRAVTLATGRRRIKQVAGMLRLGEHYVESADRLFGLAVQRNFTHGRRWQTIVAACLYVVCRREKSPHLLIDFSDKLQISVFQLGAVFLKFCRLLQLSIPLIDPSLYIHRFASQLALGSQMHVVAITALRLVSSMNRDWMDTGRRPSGICGAALLIAARSHNVRCTLADVADVVSIGASTLKRRLTEFAVTPMGQLTFDQMGKVEIQLLECDPPCFSKNREREAMETLLLEMGDVDAPVDEDVWTKRIEHKWTESGKGSQLALLEDEDYGFEDANAALLQAASRQSAKMQVESVQKRSRRWLVKQKSDASLFATLELELAESIDAEAEAARNRAADEDEIDDAEIDAMILTDREAATKTKLWETIHADYLAAQAEKEAYLESQPVKRKKAKRARTHTSATDDADMPPPDTAQHAIYTLQTKQRSKSKNINYDVLAELFAHEA
ncbi:Aste57867_13566 [Aphanomyces stellatus]|uniref:B-related factor 1 n=1 Tax=Aphanomyces stellatus TaxID=120398 RepID=A0A485KZ69_9STRA|nr:hypothetical protein As57867_013516 [Aphanomyces stellatus]VFT90404.1 Aste57867_13566 [Aphanomyces stellatus]